jgi:hypothetical protein
MSSASALWMKYSSSAGLDENISKGIAEELDSSIQWQGLSIPS